MTSQPKAEDLTLPKPARTLLSRTRGILDTYVTPRTPHRSGWIVGGGTILAARWRHRESRDIDLLVHPRTETRFLQPAAAPELHRRLEATGARKISFGRFSRILFAESKIDTPRPGRERSGQRSIPRSCLSSAKAYVLRPAARSVSQSSRRRRSSSLSASSSSGAVIRCSTVSGRGPRRVDPTFIPTYVRHKGCQPRSPAPLGGPHRSGDTDDTCAHGTVSTAIQI